MALFQRNPHSDRQHQPLFSIGMNKTVLIVGLGNIGKEFKGTRHNIGFTCLDAFAAAHEFDTWADKKDLKCLMTSKTLSDTRVILCKPTTMMNLSGEAVQKIVHFYKIHHQQIIAVHDELAIPFGQIRTRVGGSDAGNNGVKSLITHIGPDFGRVRIGIDGEKSTKMDSADYVLAKFTQEEQEHLPALTREVTSVLTEYIFSSQLPHDTRSFMA
ncbi:MAG TPA: aminoacyl-tRNA hydrolase [Candidatus Limnocylindria bacterium]|nr:aminoacyl-tRNA hydrolase [Candidatus Limnocylindria bacterium]